MDSSNTVKHNSTKRTILILLLVLFSLFLVVFLSKFITLQILSSKLAKNQNLNNYYIEANYYYSSLNGSKHIPSITSIKTFYKDGNFVSKSTYFAEHQLRGTVTHYQNQNDKFILLEDSSKLILTAPPLLFPCCSEPNSILQNLYLAVFADVKITPSCYIIQQGHTIRYYDFETGLLLESINGMYEYFDYYYEFGSVQDSDLARPDTSGAVYASDER